MRLFGLPAFLRPAVRRGHSGILQLLNSENSANQSRWWPSATEGQENLPSVGRESADDQRAQLVFAFHGLLGIAVFEIERWNGRSQRPPGLVCPFC